MRWFNLLQRGRHWKDLVQSGLREFGARIGAIEASAARQAEDLARLREELNRLTRETALLVEAAQHRRAGAFSRVTEAVARTGPELTDAAGCILAARRGRELTLAAIARPLAESEGLAGHAPLQVSGWLDGAEIDTLLVMAQGSAGWTVRTAPDLLLHLAANADGVVPWLDPRQPRTEPGRLERPFFEHLDAILANRDLIDFFAQGAAASGKVAAQPFGSSEHMPPRIPREPKKRSVLFLHNNYYHYNTLSAGLRDRGWETVTVSLEAPDSPQRQYFHGEDVTLYDPDRAVMREKTARFFASVPERFGSMHFNGMRAASFFPDNFDLHEITAVPYDFFELRRHRMILGYMPSGCGDGGLQSSIRSQVGICGKCVWELRPDICSDARNLAWNRKLDRMCDWIGLELDHATPERVGAKTVYGPVVTALDPKRWAPDIEIPEVMLIERPKGAMLIYHAVGNYATRRADGRDIKGTGAVFAAVERLKSEGHAIELIFAHDVPSTRVRYLQVQADIVVDQLNYGRYGANAREALMLGKPTLCFLSSRQAPPLPPARAIEESPLVNASEETVFDRLRELVLDPALRGQIGARSRAFALAWHGQDACAARYERVVERIRDGLAPESDDLYPPRDACMALQPILPTRAEPPARPGPAGWP